MDAHFAPHPRTVDRIKDMKGSGVMEGYFWAAAIMKDCQFRSCEADGLMLNIRLVKPARSIVGTNPRPEDQKQPLPFRFPKRTCSMHDSIIHMSTVAS